jgi:hypothetical protein
MTSTVVRARIDERVKREAAAVLSEIGLTLVRRLPNDDGAHRKGEGSPVRAIDPERRDDRGDGSCAARRVRRGVRDGRRASRPSRCGRLDLSADTSGIAGVRRLALTAESWTICSAK